MPRKKLPKPEPLEQFRIYYGIIPVDVEIWANSADEGGRGSWRKRDASTALDILIEAFTDKLLNPLNNQGFIDNTLKLLLGKRQTTKLISENKKILRKHKISLQKTAQWLLAAELQKTFITLKNAVVNNPNNLGHLPINSTNHQLRQKLLKGTF